MRTLQEIDNDRAFIIGAIEQNINDLGDGILEIPYKFKPAVIRLVGLTNQLAASYREAAEVSDALVARSKEKTY